MTATSIRSGLTVLAWLAASPLQASAPGRSATFTVGAVVVDVCQVTDMYSRYAGSNRAALQRRALLCDAPRPAAAPASEPVTTVTRAASGEITGLSLEF